MGEANGISAGNVPALPEWAGEEIFRFLEDRYGAKFIDSLGGLPRERVMLAWREELIGYTPREIKRGLHACRSRVWPPTCMEFLLLCRPVADAKGEWVEAREQMAIRMRGQGGDRWSRAQVYWAAAAIGGYDLQTLGWETVRARWEYALSNAKSDPVPDFVAPQAALPTPGQETVTRDEARKRIAQLAATRTSTPRAAPPESNKDWAVGLMRREASGEGVAFLGRRVWREVLGFAPNCDAAEAMRQWDAKQVAA